MRIRPTAPLAALSLALLLTACATPPPAGDTPPPAAGTPPPTTSLPPANDDTCGAAAYSSTIGDDYRTVPAAPSGRVFRVVCTTCPMTKDLNPRRLNFLYDEPTGKVVRLTCG